MYKKEQILKKKQEKIYKDVLSVLKQCGVKSKDVKVIPCDPKKTYPYHDDKFEIFFNGVSWGFYREFKVKSIDSFIKSMPIYNSWCRGLGLGKRITCKLIKHKNKNKYKTIKQNAHKKLYKTKKYSRAKAKRQYETDTNIL